MTRLGLRFQFACALLATSALAVAVSSVLTGHGLARTFDDYLQARVRDATQRAVVIGRDQYDRAGGRWSQQALDGLAHDFALTGYDLRLTSMGKTLINTGRLAIDHGALVPIATAPVSAGDGRPIGTVAVLGRTGSGSFPGDAQFRRAFDRAHLVAALAAGAIAAVFGAMAAGWLTRPLRRLAVAARSLSEGARNVPVSIGGPPEVRALGAAINDLSAGLDRQEASRRHLAENLAHELRTPLMLIQGRIEAMQDGVVNIGPTGMEALHTEVLRLSRLVGQIERLATDEADPPTLSLRPVALHEIALDTYRTFAGAFETRGINFEVNASIADAVADPDAVRQIVTNLLTNAAKYAPTGGRVEIVTQQRTAEAFLRVADNGSAIPAAQRELIFRRFVRGETPDGTRGVGLGLAIARDLAEAMGGALQLAPGEQGNTFELRLPAANERNKDAKARPFQLNDALHRQRSAD